MVRRFTGLVLAWAATPALGAIYYVAPSGGSDSNAGTIGAPFASFTKAVSAAAAGDTIYARGGTYNLSARVRITKSGTAVAPLSLLAYPGETPVLDFSANASTTDRGLQLDASYWTIRGLTLQKAPDNGLHITGSNNLIDRVVARWNRDSGVQIAAGSIGNPSYNVIRNTDSYENYDPAAHGENADGFAVKFRGIGPGNVITGARSWGNSDDGFDFWAAENGVRVEGSWSFRNGINLWGDTAYAGDGNGIKLGHDSGAHVLTNNLIWSNPTHGIDINGNATALEYPDQPIAHGVQIYNNTAYGNGGRNFYFDEAFAHILRNNASLAGGSADTIVSGNVNSNNSWNGAAFATSAADFVSLSDTGATGPRDAWGNLPQLPFLHLLGNSNLVNSGYDVGNGFQGAGPEVGAFEYLQAVPEPTGGTAFLMCIVATFARRRPKSTIDGGGVSPPLPPPVTPP